MTVNPLDGRLYLSDSQTRQILRVKTMGSVRDLDTNYEVIAGSGEQCYPGDAQQCGDEQQATGAKLFYPKGRCSKTEEMTLTDTGYNDNTISNRQKWQ